MATIGYSGRIASAKAREEALRTARAYAEDMEWEVRPHRWTAARAQHRGKPLECPVLEGILLRPHFACDTVPLLFRDADGDLMELPLREDESGCAIFESEVHVRTFLAGPAVHREVVGFLDALAPLAELLRVEDESDWARHRDEGRLLAAFREEADDLARKIAGRNLQPGDPLSLGGYSIKRPAEGDRFEEFGRVTAMGRALLRGLEQAFVEHPVCRFLLPPRSPPQIEDLELVMSDLDPRSISDDDADTVFTLGAAVCCGRALVARFGGHWTGNTRKGFSLKNLGGVGIECDPYILIAARLDRGPPFSLRHQEEFLALAIGILEAAGFRQDPS